MKLEVRNQKSEVGFSCRDPGQLSALVPTKRGGETMQSLFVILPRSRVVRGVGAAGGAPGGGGTVQHSLDAGGPAAPQGGGVVGLAGQAHVLAEGLHFG